MGNNHGIHYNLLEDESVLDDVVQYGRISRYGVIKFVKLFRNSILNVDFIVQEDELGYITGLMFSRNIGMKENKFHFQKWRRFIPCFTENELRGVFCKARRLLNLFENETNILKSFGYEMNGPYIYSRNTSLISKNGESHNVTLTVSRNVRILGTNLDSVQNIRKMSIYRAGVPLMMFETEFETDKGDVPYIVTHVEKMMMEGRIDSSIDGVHYFSSMSETLRDRVSLCNSKWKYNTLCPFM